LTRIPRILVAVATLAAAACGKELPSTWVTVPTRASHEARFPIATGLHAAADCNGCHGTYDTFKRFDCAGACHAPSQTSTAHQGIAGYASDGPSCVKCHPQGTMAAPANHATALFPIGGTTAHAAVGCTQCHLNLGTPTDPTAFGCYACHSTLPTGWPHPSTVGGVAILTIHTSQNASTSIDITKPATCLRCHADSQVDTVASHPGGDGSPSKNGAHGGAGCLTCHSAMRTDKPFGANFHSTPPPGSGAGCGICHSSQPN
jgi:hypothetical protein